MASSRRGRWFHYRLYGLAPILFIVASMGTVSACGPRATPPSRVPSTAVQKIHTVYYTGQYGSVGALQSGNGGLRWHQQLDKQWSLTASLLVVGDVLYVGRQTCPAGCLTLNTAVGFIDALKVSDGTVLWHSKVGMNNDVSQSVKVMAVVNHIVYVGVYEEFGGDSAGEVYALQATNGSLLWHYTVKGGCCRGLVVTKTAIYVGEIDRVDALKTSDGTLLWHHQIDSPSISLGIVEADGVVYVGTVVSDYNGIHKSAVEALRASNGTLIWHSETNRTISFILTVAGGVVYASAFLGQTLDALRAIDGSLLWQYQDTNGADRGIVGTTVMGGVAYVTSVPVGYADTGSTLDALRTSNGTHLWRYYIEPQSVTDAQDLQVAMGGGMVYVYKNGGRLHGIVALDGNSGNKRWFHAADHIFALAV